MAYLISAGAGTSSNVLAGKNAGDLPNPPFIGVLSESATEIIPFSGNYMVRTRIEIHTNAAKSVKMVAATMKTTSDATVQAAFDAIHDHYDGSGHALADLINAASTSIDSFTVECVEIRGIEQDRGEKEGEWIDTMNLEILCRTS